MIGLTVGGTGRDAHDLDSFGGGFRANRRLNDEIGLVDYQRASSGGERQKTVSDKLSACNHEFRRDHMCRYGDENVL